MIEASKNLGEEVNSIPLHVVHVITSLAVGGAERVLLDMVTHADARQLRTSIFSMTDDVSLLQQYAVPADSVLCLNFKQGLASAIRSTWLAAGWVRRERPNLMHAHMFHGLCLALLLKLLNPHIPLVFTSHNAAGFSRLRQLIIRLSRRWRSADTIFFTGQHSELNATRVVAIPNGVPVNGDGVDRWPAQPPALLFLGRLDSQKNPLGMIAAFETMKETNCQLWIAGDGVDREAVKLAVERSPARARIRLLGVISDVKAHLRQCTALVLPSRWEGLPMVILEAGALGVPVVATPVGAVPIVLADGCGYLAEEARFAEVLDTVLANRQDAEARGRRLRERVLAEYSLTKMTERFLALYRTVLSDRNCRDLQPSIEIRNRAPADQAD